MNKNLDELMVAHRGESYLAPENTLSSINLAWKNGAKAVEIDVHLSLDHEIIVSHDADTKRTGTIAKTIKDVTLKELKTVDVGSFKDIKFKGEQLPTLNEVLQTIPNDGKLIIEIKCGAEIVKPLVSIIQNSNLQIPQIEFISFDYKVLSETKKQLPEFKALWLLDLDYYIPAWLLFINYKKLLRRVRESKFDGVNVWAGKAISKKFVDFFKNQGLLVYTWTVNDPEKAKQLIKMGVDAITSDRPSWLKEQLTNEPT